MWKLWHKLFGWDYVLVKGHYFQKVCRIRYTPKKTQYVKFFGEIYLLKDSYYWPFDVEDLT